MDERGSRTAVMVAAYRARASARENPLCVDPWASALSGSEGHAFAEHFDRAYPAAELWIAVRTATLDQQVRRLVHDEGIRQAVILGAGLDTRCARLAAPGARFFEVDHPHTQADKLRRVHALPGYPRDAATYVSCDFETEDFLDRLRLHGFSDDAPALFVWEGVSMYLPEDVVRRTLGTIARRCHERTAVVFDHVGRRLVQGNIRDADDQQTRRNLADMSEPMRFGIDDIAPLLHDVGFRHARRASFDELCLSLTGTYERSRKFRFQFIALASRSAMGGP